MKHQTLLNGTFASLEPAGATKRHCPPRLFENCQIYALSSELVRLPGKIAEVIRRSKLELACCCLALLVCGTPSSAQDFKVVSLKENGALTFEADPTLSYDVEWMSPLGGTWTNSWAGLQQIQPTGSVVTVSVPRFFRVKRHEYAPRPGTEIIEIPSDGVTVESTTILRSGYRYRLEVFGTYRYDVGEPGQLADAEHVELDNHTWRSGRNLSIEGSASAVVNDGINLSHHAYSYILDGADRPISLRINDSAYSDNHGFLYGRIVDLGSTNQIGVLTH